MPKIKGKRTTNNSVEGSWRELSHAVGDFIRYWGFRRIHGEIWTQLYLSAKPMSGTELVAALGVSKALVSPALQEMLKYELIQPVVSSDDRSKHFEANPDVFSAIRKILETREYPMIQKIQDRFDHLAYVVEGRGNESRLRDDRMASLGLWIGMAALGLHPFAQMNAPEDFIKVIQRITEVTSSSS